jgi:methylthioribose-1-phosphate isomerase
MSHGLCAVEWTGSGEALSDQTRLPHRTETKRVQDMDTLVDAIQRLMVRGTPRSASRGRTHRCGRARGNNPAFGVTRGAW